MGSQTLYIMALYVVVLTPISMILVMHGGPEDDFLGQL